MLGDSPVRVEDCLRRIDEWETQVQAWAWLDRERALSLKGVPVGIKDVIDTEGIPTENGSALHAGRVPERSAEVAGPAGRLRALRTLSALPLDRRHNRQTRRLG